LNLTLSRRGKNILFSQKTPKKMLFSSKENNRQTYYFGRPGEGGGGQGPPLALHCERPCLLLSNVIMFKLVEILPCRGVSKISYSIFCKVASQGELQLNRRYWLLSPHSVSKAVLKKQLISFQANA